MRASATDRSGSHGPRALPDRPLRPEFARANLYTAIPDAYPQNLGTFGAERRRGDTVDSSIVRTHAQTRADPDSLNARIFYLVGSEYLIATVMRAAVAPIDVGTFLGCLRYQTAQS